MFSTLNDKINLDQFAQLCDKLGLLLSNDSVITIDSRKAKNGAIFCAYPGVNNDGRKYIPDVLKNNPAAILWEDGAKFAYTVDCLNFAVENLMHYVGLLAAKAHGFPSQKINNLAITGTNGKTSISHWLNQAFSLIGETTAIIGTTGCGIYPNVNDYASTTPDPITLQQLIANFAKQNVNVLAMEVSSHALDQGRVNGMEFTTAIFTNLTQDHLDYHVTMENYYQAKRELFYWHGLKNAIINTDDIYGRRLYNDLKQNNSQVNLIGYGINSGDLQASNIQLTIHGTSFELSYASEVVVINTVVLGEFNIYNLLAVFAGLIANGVEFTRLPVIALQLKPVIGRMDATIIIGKPLVVVDYAHTPDALEKALQTLQQIEHDKLICVFGCGGNRDKTKRPQMGKIAVDNADFVIITSDNPRDEDPQGIINDIFSAINDSSKCEIIENRREAIHHAITKASALDIILVAGKGHENYQEIAGVKHHFSDLEIVAEYLS